jgi:G:T-mismatch repair DNA endonuclease (very short patch repair protein)
MLQIRLNRIEEAENFQEVAKRLQRLGETFNLHHEVFTTEREVVLQSYQCSIIWL